ncbi:MAG TPA: hemophore [Mycobacterium sp.]|nr:hemophore [Mycobacterium sp.]
MTTTAPKIARRVLRGIPYGIVAACLAGGAAAAAFALPSATAAPNPCAASEIARTIGSVSTNTGNYLDSHPDTNAALTSAAAQPPPQALTSLKTYFDANPQVGKDLQNIQQPLTGLTGQCKLPISLPQALQFIQTMAQNGGALPGAGTLPATGAGTLPAGLPSGYGAAEQQATQGSPGPATTTPSTPPISLH